MNRIYAILYFTDREGVFKDNTVEPGRQSGWRAWTALLHVAQVKCVKC